MPLTHFTCPDGSRVSTQDCLEGCPGECLTLATRLEIVQGERLWTGVPHTTQLLNGLRMEWLRITRDYAIKPKSRAFALLGVAHHKALADKLDMLTEIELLPNGLDHRISVIDLLEPDQANPGKLIITDYKTWGSYRVAQTLGIVKVGKEFTIDPKRADLRELLLQLNGYRIHAESSGYTISNMRIQITVRDGGIAMANSRGITELVYLLPVPRLDDVFVRDYFNSRAADLLHHITVNIPPPVCESEERWGGHRCREYCDVVESCPEGAVFSLQR